MILIEDGADEQLPEPLASQRLAVLEVLPYLTHKVHRYSSVDALEVYLEGGLDEMRRFNMPAGLRRVILMFKDPRAIEVVAKRMLPGCEFAAWPMPDVWAQCYERIGDLRARARVLDPSFVPQTVVE